MKSKIYALEQGINCTDYSLVKKYKDKVPIKRGCQNEQCFCTGKCNEIIGWRDKLPNER